MIQVTERAREALKAVQTQMADEPEVALRLAQVEQGQLGVFPDTGRDDDQVVEHEGRPVLLIDPEVAGELAGCTIDFEESADGVRLRLYR
jgi:Fe-S cluster assembly iron-binding protein IscA